MVRVDDKAFRLLGPKPDAAPAMTMASLEVTPTRTTYVMDGGGVRVLMTFLSPLLPHDLSVLARPVTYLSWDVQATDGKAHEVALYFDATGEWAVDKPDQKVTWSRDKAGKLDWLRIGSSDQPILAKAGDDLRIDWGYLYVAAPHSGGLTSVVASDESAAAVSSLRGSCRRPTTRSPRPARQEWPVLAFAFDLGRVGEVPQSRHVLIGYDELSTVEYMGRRLDPLWKGEGWDMADLLRAAECDYTSLKIHCAEFDDELTSDMERLGGKEYARLGALAYRQCLAAHTLALGPRGVPLVFSKENFSNGCIATVDVTVSLVAVLPAVQPDPAPRPAHPGARLRQVGPVEVPVRPARPRHLPARPTARSTAAARRRRRTRCRWRSAATCSSWSPPWRRPRGTPTFAGKYWPELTQPGPITSSEKGLDPENQLCTDDFAGHLAHNTNLSLKAIVALGGFAMLCRDDRPQGRGRRLSQGRAGHGRAVDERWPTTATTTASPSTSPAPGARSTTSSGTGSSASTCSPPDVGQAARSPST